MNPYCKTCGSDMKHLTEEVSYCENCKTIVMETVTQSSGYVNKSGVIVFSQPLHWEKKK